MSGSQGLIASLNGAFSAAGQSISSAELKRSIYSSGLAGLLERLIEHGDKRRVVIIPVDQAEELFSTDGKREAVQFLSLIEALKESTRTAAERSTTLRFVVLLTIRSDSLGKLQEQPQLLPLSPAVFSLPPMPSTEYKAVIDGPSKRQSSSGQTFRIDFELADVLVKEAQGADALPLLALTLEWLYREFHNGNSVRVGVDEYRAIGGIRGVLLSAVERAFANPLNAPALPVDRAECDRLMELLFPLLATVDPSNGAYKRRVVPRSVVRAIPGADALVSRLVEQRLLAVDHRPVLDGDGPADLVEVTHEALIRQWDAFDHWLREFASSLRTIEIIRTSASDWCRGVRDEVLLLHTGHRLAAAEALVSDTRFNGRFSDEERLYLGACRARDQRVMIEREYQLHQIAAEQATRSRQQRRFALVLGGAAVAVLILSVLIVMGRRETGRQKSLVLAAAAELASDRLDFASSLRLALLATQSSFLNPVNETAPPALMRAAQGNLLRDALTVPSSAVPLSTSSDGTRAGSASERIARVWDVQTGLTIASMEHDATVTAASLSPDGRRLVSSAGDQFFIWDVAAAKPVLPPIDFRMVGASVVFSSDGTRVAATSGSGEIRVFDAERGTLVGKSITGRYGLAPPMFDGTGQRIVTYRRDPTFGIVAEVWDVDRSQMIGESIHLGVGFPQAVISPDGRLLAGGAAFSKTIRIWNVDTGKQNRPDIDIGGLANPPGFSPDSKRIVTASIEGVARVWSAETLEPVSPPMQVQGTVLSARFSGDGTRIITASSSGFVRIWESVSGTAITLPLMHAGSLKDAKFGSDRETAITVSSDNVVQLWQARSDRLVATTKPIDETTLALAQFSRDGQVLQTVSYDGAVRAWSSDQGIPIDRASLNIGPINRASISPDNRKLATLTGLNLRLYDLSTGKNLADFEGEAIGTPTFSPSSDVVFIQHLDLKPILAAGRFIGSFQALNVITGNLQYAFDCACGPQSPKFGDRGEKAAVRDSVAIKIFDVRTGQLIQTLSDSVGTAGMSLDYSSDGKWVLDDDVLTRTVRIWDVAHAKIVGVPVQLNDAASIAKFSPDGHRFVTVSGRVVRMWDPGTGTPVGQVMMHGGPVTDVDFSPDGRRLVTASTDGTARIWSTDSGLPLNLATDPHGSILMVRFSPDGTRIVSSSQDGSARVWKEFWSSMPNLQGLREAACRQMNSGARKISANDLAEAKVIDVSMLGVDVCLGANGAT